jgi:hypothetical protein
LGQRYHRNWLPHWMGLPLQGNLQGSELWIQGLVTVRMAANNKAPGGLSANLIIETAECTPALPTQAFISLQSVNAPARMYSPSWGWSISSLFMVNDLDQRLVWLTWRVEITRGTVPCISILLWAFCKYTFRPPPKIPASPLWTAKIGFYSSSCSLEMVWGDWRRFWRFWALPILVRKPTIQG